LLSTALDEGAKLQSMKAEKQNSASGSTLQHYILSRRNSWKHSWPHQRLGREESYELRAEHQAARRNRLTLRTDGGSVPGLWDLYQWGGR
jgi:hypothetical protein